MSESAKKPYEIIGEALREGGQLAQLESDANRSTLVLTIVEPGIGRGNDKNISKIEGEINGHTISLTCEKYHRAWGKSKIIGLEKTPYTEPTFTFSGSLDGKPLTPEDAKSYWERWYTVVEYKRRSAGEQQSNEKVN
jgi:hypothetical protein